MTAVTCPAPADLERLFLGGLPEERAAALEQHVLDCGPCLEQLKTLFAASDTLAGLLHGATNSDPAVSSPLVADLVQHLKALRSAAAPSVAAEAAPGAPKQPPATQGTGPDLSHPGSLTAFLAPAQADDELGRLGQYRILEVLGSGGMGVVFRAEDLKLKRPVALKAMLPAVTGSRSAGQRFQREAEAMAAVEHDHIVRIYQVDADRGVPFLAMELLRGESLDARLKRNEKLPLAEVLRIGREIAEALAAAHATGLIHRDVKPANVWLEAPRDRVKLLDFGLARAAAQEAGLTQRGAIIGTPAYMAPEQGRGDPVDARCDLFSLGVVLYRLCCGQVPFRGKDSVSTLMLVASHEPESPIRVNADLPPELSDLVMQLLAKDAERRPESAAVVIEVLQTLERTLVRPKETAATVVLSAAGLERAAALSRATPGPQPEAPAPEPEHKPAAPAREPAAAPAGTRQTPILPRRRSLVLAAAGVATLALVLAGVVLFWQTARGTVRIEINDPEIKVALDKGGATITGADKNDIRVAAGAHALHVQRGSLEFDTDQFLLKKGETVTLKVELVPGAVQVVQDGKVIGKGPLPGGVQVIDPVWFETVAALPAEAQVAAVAAKLKERNPGFDSRVKHTIDGGVVTGLEFSTDKVTDLWPVRALTGLRTLICRGTESGKGQLADLAPLQGMKLTYLDCRFTKVSDLSPLRGMPLTTLELFDTAVADLAPLQGMKLTRLTCGTTKVLDLSPLKGMALTELDLHGTPVSDLSPLQGMPLVWLRAAATKVSDLSPLRGMPLKVLYCGSDPVSDLSPLKGMPLTVLDCGNTQVTDLSPLKDMKLTILRCYGIRIADLSPLRGMPLKELACDFKVERDTEILRSLKTLKKINDQPAADFWKEVDGK
jgi:hypothetical protein